MTASYIFSVKSQFKMYWELFIIGLALINSLDLPLSIAMKPPYSQTSYYQIFTLSFDTLFLFDIIFTFRSAKFNIMTGEEVKEPKQIAKKYLFSARFVFDVLSCMPWN